MLKLPRFAIRNLIVIGFDLLKNFQNSYSWNPDHVGAHQLIFSTAITFLRWAIVRWLSHCFWEVDLIQQWGCSLDPFFLYIPGQNAAITLAVWNSLEEVNIYKLTKHDPNMDAKNMRGWKQNLAMFVKRCNFLYLKKDGYFFFSPPIIPGPRKTHASFPEPAGKTHDRGGVLLADIAFNRLAAQNLHQQGLPVMPSLLGMRKEHSNPYSKWILSKKKHWVDPDFVSQFWVDFFFSGGLVHYYRMEGLSFGAWIPYPSRERTLWTITLRFKARWNNSQWIRLS